MTVIPMLMPESPCQVEVPLPPDKVYMWGPTQPPAKIVHAELGPVPRLIMDDGHDYHWKAGVLYYHYTGGDNCWIVLQYGEPEIMKCPWCSETISEDANYCAYCGSRVGDF